MFTLACLKKVEWTLYSSSVAEPYHFFAAPGENFDAAPAPTLLYCGAVSFFCGSGGSGSYPTILQVQNFLKE
jgi:hypothetical protein